jgi:hypothetical protein
MKRGASLLLSVLAIVVTPRSASAGPTEQDRIVANALFDEARALMAAGRYAEACPKFAESLRLQPGGGTLLNLGVCHENEGKTATAWGELKAALALARRDNREDREKLAIERLAAIEPVLSYVTVRVSEDARIEDLEVRLDGAVLGAPSWGSARPIDPGEHELSASAPGHERFVTTFEIRGDGHRAAFDVPRLSALPAREALGARGSILKGQHIAGIVSGGIGLVGIALGAGFGAAAASAWSDSDAQCPRPHRCTADGAEAARDAGRYADISTVGFVTGGVGLGLGAILFATGPSLIVENSPDGAVAAVRFRWP